MINLTIIIRRIIFVSFLAASGVRAQALKVDSIFTDHMVIQRDQPFVVMGNGEPHARVSLQVGSATAVATGDAAGQWELKLIPPAVGGPYTAQLAAGSEHPVAHRRLCGDVWLCAGQSNMQLGVHEDPHGEQLLRTAGEFPHLHLLLIPKHGADHPESRTRRKMDRRHTRGY